jgi:hypothetical protein
MSMCALRDIIDILRLKYLKGISGGRCTLGVVIEIISVGREIVKGIQSNIYV